MDVLQNTPWKAMLSILPWYCDFLTATMPSKAKIDRPTWLPERGQKPFAWQNSKSNVFTEQLPRCACHNLAARRNCWGPNKLWDESRSEGTQNYSLCIKTMKAAVFVDASTLGCPAPLEWYSILKSAGKISSFRNYFGVNFQILICCNNLSFILNNNFRCESRHHGLRPFSQSCERPGGCR